MSGWSKQRLALNFAEAFQVQGANPVQEDYFEINVDRGIFLLADGFGGGAGREAAELAVKSARKFMEQEAGTLMRPSPSSSGPIIPWRETCF